jgi:AcrR family transcriptional regulator
LDTYPELSGSEPTVRKIDRRVSRTRRQLREALFNLILEKGYDAATVEEITARADVGRTTFYLHYHDKEDLLMESIGELVDDLIEQMARFPMDEWKLERGSAGSAPSPAIVLPFQHVASHARLYLIVLRGDGTYSVSRRLREIIVQASAEMARVLLERDELGALNSQVPMDVFMNYIAGAWLGLITWWLENEMPYPAEQIAGMFQRMVVQGAPEALGIPPQG